MMWHVGQKIVCVRELAPPDGVAITVPVLRVVYTIRRIEVASCCAEHAGVNFFLLMEIYNPLCPGCGLPIDVNGCDEETFPAWAFRPLLASKTAAGATTSSGMDLLRKLADEAGQRVRDKQPEKVR